MTPLVQLRSASRELEATLAPAANLVCASLRHRGAELLGQRGGVEAYVEKSSTMGIPLLHPWANRLAAPAYRVSGTEVRFDPASPLIKLDPGGLPIHGVAPRRLRWEVEESEPEWLSARLRWEDEDLLAVFPFRHELVTRVWIGDDGLSYRTTLRPTGEQPVPVAFGYHPYLVLPGVPRTEWEIELPVTRRLDLDARGIPTGEVDVVEESPGPLHQVYAIPKPVLIAMTSRIKLLARMEIVEKRRPQDGRIKTRHAGRRGGRAAHLDDADRVRREGRDAHLRRPTCWCATSPSSASPPRTASAGSG